MQDLNVRRTLSSDHITYLYLTPPTESLAPLYDMLYLCKHSPAETRLTERQERLHMVCTLPHSMLLLNSPTVIIEVLA